MKNLTLIFITLFLAFSATAQNQSTENYFAGSESIFIPPDTVPSAEAGEDNRLSLGVETGASVATGSAQFSSYETYVAPHLQYDFTPRFSVRTGLMFSRGSVSNGLPFTREGFNSFSGNYNRTAVYAEGIYEMTHRLKIRSSIMYDMYNWDSAEMGNNSLYSPGLKAYSIGFDYQISPNASIHFRYTARQGTVSPFGYNYGDSPLFQPVRNHYDRW